MRNKLLFTLAFWMADPPPGDFSVLVFEVSKTLEQNMRSGRFPIPLNLEIGLQRALESLGFDPNGLDGVFGRGTRTALTRFQAAHGLQQSPNVKRIEDVPDATMVEISTALDSQSIAHIP